MRGAAAGATGRAPAAGKGRRGAARGKPSRRAGDALALLTEDHARVAQLFARFARLQSDGVQKAALVERICDEIEVHARIEEEIFYPSVRALIGDGDLMDEAAVEHEMAKALVGQLRALRPGDFHYDAKVTVLGEYIRHHVDEEQRQMFPKVRRTGLDLVALGRALKARKRQLKMPGPRPDEAGTLIVPGGKGA